MRPTLRQLEYLVAIADTGTFSDAAQLTFVSQPSLSAQIKDMEDYLGAVLFERSRKGAILTPFGHECAQRARVILSQVEALKVLASDVEGSLAGIVKLGTLPTVGPYLLPKATRALHTAYPNLKLLVREERTIDLQNHLEAGTLDIIISTPRDHPGMNSMPLVMENLYVCMAQDDPLATERGEIELNALEGRELLTLGYGHNFASVVQNIAIQAGAMTHNAYEGTSLDAIRQMSHMGVGIGVLPSLYATSEAKRDKDLIVRRINHPSAQRQISLIWRANSPLEQKFLTMGDIFQSVAKDIMT